MLTLLGVVLAVIGLLGLLDVITISDVASIILLIVGIGLAAWGSGLIRDRRAP